MSAVCKPEAKISFARKCLCSNSRIDLWKLELEQRVHFVDFFASKQFIQGYLQHRRRKSCLGVAKTQNIHTSLFREAHNIKSFDRKCSKTNTSFTAGPFLETNYAYYKRRMGTPWFRSLHVTECKVTLSPNLCSLEWLHHSSSRVSELLAPCISVSWLL